MVFREDAGFVEVFQRPGFAGLVFPVQDNAVGLGFGNMGMAGQVGLRESPKAERLGLRAKDKVGDFVIFLAVEVPDFHQLAGRGIAFEPLPVFDDFPGKERPDARQGDQRGAVGRISM